MSFEIMETRYLTIWENYKDCSRFGNVKKFQLEQSKMIKSIFFYQDKRSLINPSKNIAICGNNKDYHNDNSMCWLH